MKVNAPIQLFNRFRQNQQANRGLDAGGYHWLEQRERMKLQIHSSPSPKRPQGRCTRPELCVEELEVYAAGKFMYCKGIVRSQGSRLQSNVVVAVEWLDDKQNTLNTDWSQIDKQVGHKRLLLMPNAARPFIIKAPLDRRVKSVKAYAFSSPH